MNATLFHPSRGALLRRVLSRSCLFICLAWVTALGAQGSRTGTVSGVVSNDATGDLLPGAVVTVQGSTATATAERGGTFSLTLPEGPQTLNVSFAGLDTQQVRVVVAPGQNVVADVKLTTGIYKLEAFSVSGVREGNARALQSQRDAVNAKTVAATDTFGNPAANPGELIQRLPGISTEIVGSEVRTIYIRGMGAGFSSLLVDGDRTATSTGTSASRDYQIEQLGTGNIESVELIKAPLPEHDANAIAGYANLVQRRAFDLPGRRITLTGGVLWRMRDVSGESPFRDGADNLDLITLSYSDVFNVFGGDRNLGIALNVNRRVSATTQDEMGPGGVDYTFAQTYLNPNSTNPLTRVFGTGDFGYDAIAHNAGLSVDYKISPHASAFVKFSFNSNDQHQEYLRPAFGNTGATVNDFAPGSTYEHSTLLPTAASFAKTESSLFTKKSMNYGISGGTEFKLFDNSTTVSVRGNYSFANINYPAWIRTRANIAGGIGFEIDRRGQDAWYPIVRQTAGPSVYDAANYRMTAMTRQSYKAPNDLFSVRTDVTKRFGGSTAATLKFGLKYDDDQRKQRTDYDEWTFVGRDGVPNSADDSLSQFLTYHYNHAGDRYGPFPFMQIPGSARINDPVNAAAGSWARNALNVYNAYQTATNGDAEFSEKIGAAYVQGSMKLGKLKIVAGVRVEETETEGTAWVRNTTAAFGGNPPTGTAATSYEAAALADALARSQRSFRGRFTDGGDYRKYFPGVHMVYEPIPGWVGRASYNKSISRPPVANILPTVSETGPQAVTIGNPSLRPYMADNFDLSLEKYFEPVGLVSVGVFQKNISDYFRTFADLVGPEGIDGSGLYAGYTLSTARNIGDARIRGIEARFEQQFSFLPGIWKGLGAFANFTYLEAKGDFGTTATTSRLANLSPRSGNGGLNFRYRGLDVRYLVNWTDEKYKSLVSGIEVFNEARLMMDVKIQYAVNRTYSVFLDATNITDEPPRTDVSQNGLKFFQTKQGVGFVAGVRARF